MNVRFQKSFTEQFSKLSKTQKRVVKDALEMFGEDPVHASLRNHPLKGRWSSYRSIAADDDLRLHYRILDEDTALFVAVGTHDQLYR
jgi:addiction module RelE/StbE family toxin